MNSAFGFFFLFLLSFVFLRFIGFEHDTALEIIKWFLLTVVGSIVIYWAIKIWNVLSKAWGAAFSGQRQASDPGVILSNRVYHADALGAILSNQVYHPSGPTGAGSGNPYPSFGHGDSVESMTGAEFEQYVASTLRNHGWSAEVTKTGADQGLDVLARKGALVVAIQCKRYAQAVSNGAIQEVHAARSFYDANRACVITTSRFTRSAHDLATKLDVKLLHYDDLDALDRYVT